MKVLTTAFIREKGISLEGAHELSWAYLLDFIYADAYHRGIQEIQFFVDSEALLPQIRLRSDVTPSRENSGHSATALLGISNIDNSDINASFVYTVEYGLLSPRQLRRKNPVLQRDLVLVKQYSVFTWKARFWGIPIRLASMLSQPHLFDRFMKKMRSVFLEDSSVPAYYHLKIWEKPQNS